MQKYDNEVADFVQQLAQVLEPAKMKIPVLVAGVSLPFTGLLEKYLFNDWEFLVFLVIIVAIDTLTGLWKSWKRSEISSSGWGRIISKTIAYGLFLVVLHILGNHSEKEAVRTFFGWATTAGYSALIVREAISIVENLDAIHPGIIPTWISKRLKEYDKHGPDGPKNSGNETT